MGVDGARRHGIEERGLAEDGLAAAGRRHLAVETERGVGTHADRHELTDLGGVGHGVEGDLRRHTRDLQVGDVARCHGRRGIGPRRGEVDPQAGGLALPDRHLAALVVG
jgi:hypothetical protein